MACASDTVPWREISFSLPSTLIDSVSQFLEDQGAQAVTLAEGGNESLFEPPPGETPLWQTVRLTALFTMEDDTEAIATVLRTHYSNLHDWEHRILEDQPWERAWLEHYRPIGFGRLWVCPTGHLPPDPEAVCLTLDPGLAFGTGTHPTTALCLEWLANQKLNGLTIVDYGCGSGILAIAALLLGARRVIACDIDPQALTATRDNAAKNQVADRLDCCYPEDMPEMTADILVANILAGPLVEMAPTLSTKVRSGGAIVLSGILAGQVDEVHRAFETHYQFEPPAIQDQWARLTGTKHC